MFCHSDFVDEDKFILTMTGGDEDYELVECRGAVRKSTLKGTAKNGSA